MENTYCTLARTAKKALVAAGLFAALQPAFGLEINNNTGSAVKAAISACALSAKVNIAAGQVYSVEGDPSAVCKYSIVSGNGMKCSGTVNAASGLQVSVDEKSLNCVQY